MPPPLHTAIASQRASLETSLGELLEPPLIALTRHLEHRHALDETTIANALAETRHRLPIPATLWLTDTDGRQLGFTEAPDGQRREMGRDRSHRPYFRSRPPQESLRFAEPYIRQTDHRVAVAVLRQIPRSNRPPCIVGVEILLRDLPLPSEGYAEPDTWRQLRGDPSIRAHVFAQTRSESLLDRHIDDVLDILTELICERGVFHGKLHFSTSRCTIWLTDDPYRYRLIALDDLIDPALCLAYPTCPYPPKAVIPKDRVRPIFERFRELRFGDESLYLRSGSLNIINGLVGLNFSCDGSHYLRAEDFLEMGRDFWLGGACLPPESTP